MWRAISEKEIDQLPLPPAQLKVLHEQSAHVAYVESEFIARSAHSCQGNPATIEEVRRILLEHLAATAGDGTGNPPAVNQVK